MQAQCLDNEQQAILNLVFDTYPQETGWRLQDLNGNIYLQGHGTNGQVTFSDTVCVPAATCLTLNISDSYGDGMCCSFGDGTYTLLLNDAIAAQGGEFTFGASHEIGCVAGAVCSSALLITAPGNYSATVTPSTWYTFTPDTSGTYTISTCSDLNSCDTRVWLYGGECGQFAWDNTNIGTIAYADTGCGDDNNWASLTYPLTAGTTYYIRVGGINSTCVPALSWTLTFNGPLLGCTDPTACNYNPLAQANDGSCVYQGSPNCPAGPDLIVVQSAIETSLHLSTLNEVDECYVQEGCINGYGQRHIIRFTTHIKNIGDQDYYIGSPTTDTIVNQFEWGACHGHWHYKGYAEYLIYDRNTFQIVPIGFKNGFCVLDLECSGGGSGQYGCDNMGISAGCGDIYSSGLDCQWIDITDLPAGNYTLVVRVNWEKQPDALHHEETNYLNNWAQVCLDITRDPLTNIPHYTIADGECLPYVDCTGEAFGNAKVDCEGTCTGIRKAGDIDRDTTLAMQDVYTYINEILTDTITPTSCIDLNADNDISVADATLLLECVLHPNGVQGHNHSTCAFPFGILNINDTITLSVSDINTTEKYFDVLIKNPTARVAAYQFKISGATIDHLTSLAADYNTSLYYSDDEILSISIQENTITKHNSPTELVRVYYTELTDNQVCISEIATIFNALHEETINVIGNCSSIINNTSEAFANMLDVKVVPNPFNQSARILFNNVKHENFTIQLIDFTGRLVRTYQNITDSELTIWRGNLPAGVYTCKVSTSNGWGITRLVIE